MADKPIQWATVDSPNSVAFVHQTRHNSLIIDSHGVSITREEANKICSQFYSTEEVRSCISIKRGSLWIYGINKVIEKNEKKSIDIPRSRLGSEHSTVKADIHIGTTKLRPLLEKPIQVQSLIKVLRVSGVDEFFAERIQKELLPNSVLNELGIEILSSMIEKNEIGWSTNTLRIMIKYNKDNDQKVRNRLLGKIRLSGLQLRVTMLGDPPTCFICEKQGHTKANCENKKKHCLVCKTRFDHSTEECTIVDADTKTKKEMDALIANHDNDNKIEQNQVAPNPQGDTDNTIRLTINLTSKSPSLTLQIKVE